MAIDHALQALGQRIREERNRIRLSQIDFGKLADVSENTQTSYEKGRIPPKADYFIKLLQHNIDVSYLVTGQRSSGDFSFVDQKILGMVHALSHREREAVLSLLSVLTGHTIDVEELARQARTAKSGLLQELANEHGVHSPRIAYRGRDDEQR